MALTLEDLLSAAPYWDTQIALVLIQAAIWYFGIKFFAKRVFEPFVRSKPWFEQWTTLTKRTLKTGFFIDFEHRHQVVEFGCEMLAWNTQHGFGGALCIPSLLGFRGPLVNTLACHGAVCEAGWELQDLLERFFQVTIGGDEGKQKNPAMLVFLICMHHGMGMAMVVPMNIWYQENTYYHELVFLLQFAALCALLSQNYGFTLDVKTQQGLCRMKMATFTTFAIMFWTRIARFIYIGYVLMVQFIEDNNVYCIYVGGTVLGMMGIVNLFFVLDAFGKFLKFIKMKPEEAMVEADQMTGSFVM